MRKIAMILAAVCLSATGCQQQQPAQPIIIQQPGQNKVVVIERDRKPSPPKQQPPVQINVNPPHHCPPPPPTIRIDLGPKPSRPHSSCTQHKHCGKCDTCKKHGWVVEVRPQPDGRPAAPKK